MEGVALCLSERYLRLHLKMKLKGKRKNTKCQSPSQDSTKGRGRDRCSPELRVDIIVEDSEVVLSACLSVAGLVKVVICVRVTKRSSPCMRVLLLTFWIVKILRN